MDKRPNERKRELAKMIDALENDRTIKQVTTGVQARGPVCRKYGVPV